MANVLLVTEAGISLKTALGVGPAFPPCSLRRPDSRKVLVTFVVLKL